MSDMQRISALARSLLSIETADAAKDLFVWQHSERVMRLAAEIARLPDFADERVDRTGLAIAALFHDAGWVVPRGKGRPDRAGLLVRPTSDIQRELAAGFVREHLAGLVGRATLEIAVEAIRQCNDRGANMIEAKILAEADNLDEIGAMYVIKQIRQYEFGGGGVVDLLQSRTRQSEYGYWEARIRDCFRFESVRRLAQARLSAVQGFITALGREQNAEDIRGLIEGPGSAAAGPIA